MSTCKKVESGEWVQPRRKNYFMECCDCGLIHRLNFRLLKHGKGKKIQFQAFRATAKAAKDAIKAEKKRNADQTSAANQRIEAMTYQESLNWASFLASKLTNLTKCLPISTISLSPVSSK